LEIDSDLMATAAVRAQEITDVRGYTRPDGSDFSSVFSEFGISCSRVCSHKGIDNKCEIDKS